MSGRNAVGQRALEAGGRLAANDDRDATIARIERICGEMQLRVRKPADRAELAGSQTLALHDAPRRVGAIGGQLPVAVADAAAVGTAVGVALDHDVVVEAAELVRDDREDALAFAAQRRAAAVKEARPRSLDQLDPEAFGRQRELDLRSEE